MQHLVHGSQHEYSGEALDTFLRTWSEKMNALNAKTYGNARTLGLLFRKKKLRITCYASTLDANRKLCAGRNCALSICRWLTLLEAVETQSFCRINPCWSLE